MAAMVELGAGIQSSSVEAYGRPALHGSRPQAYAGTRDRTSAGRGCGTLDHPDTAQSARVGRDVEPLTTEQLLLVVTAYPLDNAKKAR
jgi:hypothetical protein